MIRSIRMDKTMSYKNNKYILRPSQLMSKNSTPDRSFWASLTKNKSNQTRFILKGKTIGEWDPFEKIRCMICWKPIDSYKDVDKIMECPNCHQKAHQEHMLRWLATKKYCPYCKQPL